MDSRTADEVLLSAARMIVGISVRAADQIGGISLVQLRALTVLSDLGDVNLMHLARAMGVTVSTTSRLVDRLLVAGLADRRPSEVNRREISISLSPSGRDVLRRYDEIRVQSLRRGLDQLGQRQQEATVSALEGLVSTGPPTT